MTMGMGTGMEMAMVMEMAEAGMVIWFTFKTRHQ